MSNHSKKEPRLTYEEIKAKRGVYSEKDKKLCLGLDKLRYHENGNLIRDSIIDQIEDPQLREEARKGSSPMAWWVDS